MTKRLKNAMAVVVAGLLLLVLGWGGFAMGKPKPPATPPTLDQCLGTWSASYSLTEYDLPSGAAYSYKGTAKVVVTKIDDQTVDVEITDSGVTWDRVGYYSEGIFVMETSDDYGLGYFADSYSFFVTGTAGKLTAKGQWLGYDLDAGFVDVGTASVKQISTH